MTTAPRTRLEVRRRTDRAARAPARRGLALACGGLALAIVGLTALCRRVLGGAAELAAVPDHDVLLYLLAGTFLFAVGAAGFVHAAGLARRVAGPEHRLIESLRRLRSGDLTFRVCLRRGDLLGGLARECNEVLEWLNANPPRGARTGSDVFDVEQMEGEPIEADALVSDAVEARP